MDKVMKAIAALQEGNLAEGRLQLLQCWADANQSNSPRERATIAHFLADTEKSPADELAWDLAALAAATTGEANEDEAEIVSDFLPSLYLNVADAYRRLGNLSLARQHAESGLGLCDRLTDDGYGRLVRHGLERLIVRVAAGDCTIGAGRR